MTDPLANWKTGPVKSAILDFVDRVTLEESADFVPPSERTATFDNDGTLWCEQPMQVQVFFAQDRLKALAEKDPSLRQRQPFKALLEHDLKTLQQLGKKTLFEAAFLTHAGVTESEFSDIAKSWLAIARHPKLARLFTQCVYQPQLELMNFLRDRGFKVFIVSGGGVDLIRAFAEDVYGIPPEQIVGSSVRTRVDIHGDHFNLLKLAELGTFDDREVKVENIGLHIGRRPILAFGNSDGDLAMLRYAKCGPGARLALLLHHDDGEREFAYDRDFRLSPLVEALDRADDYGIQIVSMKRDWEQVFVGESARPSAAA
jgi:phosphoglycolate phosphatase-like HAD superfamily hydrolase